MTPKEFLDGPLATKIAQDATCLSSSGARSCRVVLNISGSGGGFWAFVFDASGKIQVDKSAPSAPADCLIESSDEVFGGVLAGKVNVPMAVLTRKIKIKGDVGLAGKVGSALRALIK